MKKINIKEMIYLLEKKLGYLQDFQSLNQEETARIYQGDFNNIEAFYYDRELLLNAMDRVDKDLKKYKVDQCEGVCEQTKKQIRILLKQTRRAVHAIISQDMNIHNYLDTSMSSYKEDKIA